MKAIHQSTALLTCVWISCTYGLNATLKEDGGIVMVDDIQAEESRSEWITYMDGPAFIAWKLDLSGHSVVSNWRKNGFPDNKKAPLIQLAIDRKKDPHPELFEGAKSRKHHSPTPLSAFIKFLSKKHGGHMKMAQATGIPMLSIKSMSQRTKGIMLKHVPALEKSAAEKGVELPDFWPEVRRKYDEGHWKQ